MNPFLLLVALAVPSAAAQNDLRPLQGTPWSRHAIDDEGRGADGTKFADINGDGWPDIATGWEEGGETRVYLNPGPRGPIKKTWPKVSLDKTPAAEDAVFADLDGDGAFDVITATEGNSNRVFIHWGPADRNRILDASAWTPAVLPAVTGLGRWLFVQPFQFDGQHGPDLILGSRPGPDTPAPVIGWLKAPAHAREVAAWTWHPLAAAGWIMSIELVDMDGDGDQDILYSDRMGPTRGIYWFENPGAAAIARGQAPTRHQIATTGVHQVMFLTVGDVDGDGLQDIVAGTERSAMDRTEPNRHSHILWLRRKDRTGRNWSEIPLSVPVNTGNIKGLAVGSSRTGSRRVLLVSGRAAQRAARGHGVFF